MRNSPIQLLESFFQKVHVEPREFESPPEDESIFDKMELQFFDDIEPYSEYWEGQAAPGEGVAENTYRVTLGVRTAEGSATGVYAFEYIATGTVSCLKKVEGHTKEPKVLAREYGLTLLFGMIRESLASTTARMVPGIRLLPTVTFLGSSSKTVDQESLDGENASIEQH